MIPAKPHLSDVRINLILSDLARGNMAVIVNYRQLRGVSMIKRARRLGLEKEILSHERFHFKFSFIVCLPGEKKNSEEFSLSPGAPSPFQTSYKRAGRFYWGLSVPDISIVAQKNDEINNI